MVVVALPAGAGEVVGELLPGMGWAAMQASAQAWSRATGSKLANMPISGRMGASFSPWQSQFGLTSCTREMWKQGRSWQTAWAYSAILRSSISLAESSGLEMASNVQAPMQRPQPLHLS